MQGFIEELKSRLLRIDQDQSSKAQRAVMDVIHAMVSLSYPCSLSSLPSIGNCMQREIPLLGFQKECSIAD